MKHAIKLITVVLAMLTVNVAIAQTAAQKRADKLYGQNLYKEASVLYEHVVKKDSTNKVAYASLGHCYRQLGMPAKAERAYFKASSLGELSPQENFYYATVLAANGKEGEAMQYYKKYSADYAAKYDALDLYADSTLWKVSNTSVSTSSSDMGPAWYKKGIVFSSARKSNCAFRRTDGSRNNAFYDLYIVDDTNNVKKITPEYNKSVNKKGKKLAKYRANDDDTYNTSNDTRTVGYYGDPLIYDSLKVNKEDLKLAKKMKGINKRFNDGPVSFYPSGDSLIFTRQAKKRSKNGKRFVLELYSGKFDGEKVSDVKPLNLNSADYSIAHPSLSADGKTLYFSSDMPGGQGGTDLYMSKWDGSTWGTPVNLGSNFNTPGNESFPFINGDGQFFFASDGLPGLGGLDVFMAWPTADGSQFESPENLGYPANSAYDDFGYISDKENKTGYLSSNRRRAGLDDDLYRFLHDISVRLNILVVEEVTETPINLAQVNVDPMPAGQTATSTKEDGKSKYYLRAKNDYKVTISRDGYDVVTTDVSTQNVRPGKSIDKKIILSKYKFIVDGSVTTRSTNVGVPGATVYFKNKTTGEIITVVANEAGIFDFKLSPESDYIIYAEKGGMRTNEVSISTMGKKASENFKVDLAFDKELMLAVVYYDFDKTEVRKDDFNKKELDELVALMKAEPTMKVVAKSFADSRGESKYNDKLASKRSNAAVAYLVKKGIKKNRIIAQSFGETNLTNRCSDGVECSEEEHQANRRTEFIRAEEEVAPAVAPATN